MENRNEEQVLAHWNYRVKMLFNPILWKSFFLCFGIPIFLLGILLSVLISGKIVMVWIVCAGLFAFFFFIWILVGIAVDIAGGFSANYWLTDKGIYFSSGNAERATANVASIAGALVGSAATAGAGLLAESEMDLFIAWEKARKVKISQFMRYIQVSKGFPSKPIGLYCNAQNFDEVKKIVANKINI